VIRLGWSRAVLKGAWEQPGGRRGLLLLAVIVIVALVGPAFLPDPASQPDLIHGALLPPGLGHLFGTDQLSRDVLSRVVHGARISLSVALLAVALSATLGCLVGMVAGYFGGWTDAVLMRLVDGALAIPRLFILLLLIAVWDHIPLAALIVVLGATGWFGTSRLVRAEVLRLREQEYVGAAVALGAQRRRIILRHLLPNALAPVLVASTLAVGDVILIEAGLSFLGLGIRPPTPSWGAMILDARSTLFTAPWTGAFPGLAIVITVVAVNLVGESLRDALDPRRL